MSDDDEIVQAFLEESRENLDQLDRDLVELESRPGDPGLLAQVFRTIHTIKGTCGFLGFRRLEALTHAGENLLGALRSGELALDAPLTSSLLALVDATRGVLRRVELTGTEGEDEHAEVIARLEEHLARRSPAADPAPAPAPGVGPPGAPENRPSPDASDASGAAAESSVRVDVAVLDTLLDLVGELLLTGSQIGEVARRDEDGPLASPYHRLRLVSAELQDGVMAARLQPVGNVVGKFRRIGRDLATALGKKVRVEIEGEEVGVDKAVNEALRDPLLHLVRNAVDHGLEEPEERIAGGKPAEGLLRIRARHEGGRVQLEVSDDGRGIDTDRLVERAVASGVLDAREAAVLGPSERLELMFSPGLSTKEQVTNLSGRGVGMDVVRTDLAQVGGTIEASSDMGLGSVFRINVPLTLAIMPALVVWCGGGRYAVPQVDVDEVLRLDPEAGTGGVDDVDGVRFTRLRGRLLPLLELAGRLGVAPVRPGAELHVVVVRHGDRRFGLVVDGVGDAVEAVVKPLPRAVRAVPAFAGVTILGDGAPSLILDVAGLAPADAPGTRDDDHAADAEQPAAAPSSSGLLLVTSGHDSLALRLASVQRLERFRAEHVERAGDREVVQYGDGILPLVRAAGATAHDVLDTVVCASSAGPVALVVDRIEDVVPEPTRADRPPARGGEAAYAVVQGRVTELVDVEVLAAAAGLSGTA